MKKFFSVLCAALLLSSALMMSFGSPVNHSGDSGAATLGFHLAIEDQ